MFSGLLKKDVFIYAVLLATACLAAFFPVLFAGYIHVDDPQHFINNPLILDPSPNPFQAFFFTPDSVNRTYVPLTLWSFYVEFIFFQMNPFVSHLINLVLHYMVTFLVMLLGQRLGLSLKAAFVGALIFAVHPMHVESVAWVTERKDVLYSFFYLMALVFYSDYLDKKDGRKYIFALLAATLSVLAKPMALSLPLVLFLVDIFKRRKFSWGVLLDKVPFLLVVEPIAFITYSMNARTSSFDFFSPFIAIWCLVFYIQKFFIPVDISFFLYKAPWPVWSYQVEYAQAVGVFCVIILLLFLLRHHRWFWFAFFYYVLSTFFLWRIDGNDAHFVADRFMYLPSMGFCFLAGHFFDKISEKGVLKRQLLFSGLSCFVLVLMAVSFTKAQVWHSTFSMYREVSRRGSNNFEIVRGLALCLRSDWCVSSSCADIRKAYFSDKKKFGSQDQVCDKKIRIAMQMLSMKEFKRILTVYPDNVKAIIDVGGLYWEWGGYDKAVQYFKRSMAMLPDKAGGYYMLALCYEGKKDLKPSMAFLDKAVLMDPAMSEAYVARSRVAAFMGDKKKAVDDVLRLIELEPRDTFSYDHAIDILTKIKAEDIARAVSAMKEKTFEP